MKAFNERTVATICVFMPAAAAYDASGNCTSEEVVLLQARKEMMTEAKREAATPDMPGHPRGAPFPLDSSEEDALNSNTVASRDSNQDISSTDFTEREVLCKKLGCRGAGARHSRRDDLCTKYGCWNPKASCPHNLVKDPSFHKCGRYNGFCPWTANNSNVWFYSLTDYRESYEDGSSMTFDGVFERGLSKRPFNYGGSSTSQVIHGLKSGVTYIVSFWVQIYQRSA